MPAGQACVANHLPRVLKCGLARAESGANLLFLSAMGILLAHSLLHHLRNYIILDKDVDTPGSAEDIKIAYRKYAQGAKRIWLQQWFLVVLFAFCLEIYHYLTWRETF